jgi:hypothetical protein
MSSPLRFVDLFGVGHIEPSVTGLIEVQTTEPIPPNAPPNDLIIASPFRSGKPLESPIPRFKTLAALQDRHDPDRNGDQGVALARISKAAFADLFGSADILTVRVNAATAATTTLLAGATELMTIQTADYGSHTNRSKVTVEAGTNVGKKITLADDVRTFIGDDLGILTTIQYTGDATTATLTIINSIGKVTYTGQPTDADKITANGTVYEFDDDSSVTGGSVAVTIGADADATFEKFRHAILSNFDNVEAATINTPDGIVTITASEAGVVLEETLDSGGVYSVANTFPSGRFQTTLAGDQTDGSLDLDIPLNVTTYKDLSRLAAYINEQVGYTASVSPYANKFIPSNGLDAVSAVNIKAAAVSLTGYNAAIADFITNRTKQQYIATEVARGEPDEAVYSMTGGTTPGTTITDFDNALTLIGANVERGGILLLDTDDISVINLTATFIAEQQAAGKWFRAYFGLAPGTTVAEAQQAAGYIDSTRVRLVMQRIGVFGEDNTVEYLHPTFLAAALAGGVAGNLPYQNPLTNKRIRSAGIHPSDSYDLATRENLLSSGITIIKTENELTRIALHVTSSLDPDRRMNRIVSERDTVDQVDAAMREAFLQFRGKWANVDIGARVQGVGSRVLNQFVSDGALVGGLDDYDAYVPAWRWVGTGFVLQAGVLKLDYEIRIAGELNHISIHGVAEYSKIVGQIPAGQLVNLQTTVPT